MLDGDWVHKFHTISNGTPGKNRLDSEPPRLWDRILSICIENTQECFDALDNAVWTVIFLFALTLPAALAGHGDLNRGIIGPGCFVTGRQWQPKTSLQCEGNVKLQAAVGR